MGRRKKRSITYDSKETVTIAGLVSLVAGAFLFLSFFSSSETDKNLLSSAKEWFNSATLVAAAFLCLLGLKFLGTKFLLTKTRSIIAQLFLVFSISGFLTSITAEPSVLIKLNGENTKGGKIGYYLVNDLLGDTIPTAPLTKFILIIFIMFFGIMATGISANVVVKEVSIFFSWLYKFIKNLFFISEEEKVELQTEEIQKASKLGDFNKYLTNKKDISSSKDMKKQEKQSGQMKLSEIASQKKILRNNDIDVDIKEGSIGDDGLKQDSLKFPNWKLPPASLLIPFKRTAPKDSAINQNGRIIEQILESFAIEATVEQAFIGPSVVQYALNIPLGINVKKISNLSENLALALGVDSKAVRIDSIPETTYLGIEVPRSQRDLVRFKEIFTSDEMTEGKGDLKITLGKDINGSAVVIKIEKLPHLLIAGATGSGKSVVTNGFITSLIMTKTPDEVKLILVDPKQVEFMDYNGIPHLLTPVITDMDKVLNALKWSVGEMERRYTTLAKEQVRNIQGYNEKKGFAAMPYIIIVIDEMADMMMTGNRVETETAIVRLAQKARAVGIHLILATQRPSVNVITGIIKANIPGRVGMSVTSSTDSRVILDRIGAESLMGNGDMLYKAPDKTKSVRLQAPLVEQEEVIRVTDFIRNQAPEVEYVTEILEKQGILEDEKGGTSMSDISDDNLIEQAIRIVVQGGRGSSSYLQRRLNIGFNRAARLLEELEEVGVVGPANGSKPREVLIRDADEFISGLRGGGM